MPYVVRLPAQFHLFSVLNTNAKAGVASRWKGPVLLLLGFLLTNLVLQKIVQLEFIRAHVFHTPNLEMPRGPYFYLDAWNFELSQPVLYHDLGQSISNARRADIILIGNSRLQLGIREEFIVPLARERDLRVFSIGSGHAEGVRFAFDVIRKHKLTPKVVVILAGAHAYKGRVSGVARATMEMDRWQAQKLPMETALSWNVRYRLHRVIPRVGILNNRITSRYALFRFELTGWWKPALEPQGAYPTSYSDKPENHERILDFVSEVKSYLGEQGTLLVTGVIPYRNTSYTHLSYFKERLDIPFVNTGLQLETSDGSHLNLASAKRFTQAFWREFVALPEVQDKLFGSVRTE